MSQRNVEEDEFLDALWELVEEWRDAERLCNELCGTDLVERAVFVEKAFCYKRCAHDLERILKGGEND